MGRSFDDIHLDHSGASGNLAELLPNATFYVHEIGHPHLVDPSKPSSASRLYGEENMDELWGEVRPVPEDRRRKLEGGEAIEPPVASHRHTTRRDTPPPPRLLRARNRPPSSPGTWRGAPTRASRT